MGLGVSLIFVIFDCILFLLSRMIDPRPFHFQYRKPRYTNPTFQSRNLYESLYHRNSYQVNDYFTPKERQSHASTQKISKANYPQQYRQLQRNLSDLRDRAKSSIDILPASLNENMHIEEARKNNQGYRLPSINQNPEKPRYQNYGQPKLQTPPARIQDYQKAPIRRQGQERYRIYERQQKPFDIINCFPRENENNKLRSFPKLTLEDKLIENGSYHPSFRGENY